MVRLDEIKDRLISELEHYKERKKNARTVIVQTDKNQVDQSVSCALIRGDGGGKSPTAKIMVQAAQEGYTKSKR